MALSEGQVQDLLMLRRLLFVKLGQLTQARKALVLKISQHSKQHSMLTDIKAWAEQVQQNADEERRAARHAMTAIWLGVSGWRSHNDCCVAHGKELMHREYCAFVATQKVPHSH